MFSICVITSRFKNNKLTLYTNKTKKSFKFCLYNIISSYIITVYDSLDIFHFLYFKMTIYKRLLWFLNTSKQLY